MTTLDNMQDGAVRDYDPAELAVDGEAPPSLSERPFTASPDITGLHHSLYVHSLHHEAGDRVPTKHGLHIASRAPSALKWTQPLGRYDLC